MGQRDRVPVATRFTQQRYGVPKDEVWFVWPGQIGVARIQRARLRCEHGGRGTCELGKLGDLGSVDRVAEQVRNVTSAPRNRAARMSSIDASVHARGMYLTIRSGLKLTNVAAVTPGDTAPIGAEREAK